MSLIREEQIKADKHPFDAWDDLVRASREGFASIAPDNFLRFRWFGIYQQRPKTDPYFMLRLKLPGGRLDVTQLRVVAEVARDYGRGFADITTRQNFQFHWLTIEHVPAVLKKFETVGITTRGACGDIARNITGSPLAGFEPDEVDDLQDVILELHHQFLDGKKFTDLPRKFKVSITGGVTDVAQPAINDVGIYGFRKNDGASAFALCVGGGLSSDPRFASPLPIALKRNEIIPAVMAVLGIFHDHGNRSNRRKARMKFLVGEWGAEKFLVEMEHRAKRTFERCSDVPAAREDRDRLWGVIPQKQPCRFSVGLVVPAGRLRDEELYALADLADKYAYGEFRTTNRQNILIVNVPADNVDSLCTELRAQGFDLGENGIRRAVVVCTGREFCNLALVEVKVFSKNLIEHLAHAFPDLREMLTIHVTGCPNSCGQYQLADIGLLGTASTADGVRQEAFHIAAGAGAGTSEAWNRIIFRAVPAGEVPGHLEKMIRVYLKDRSPSQTFSSFCRQYSTEGLAKIFDL